MQASVADVANPLDKRAETKRWLRQRLVDGERPREEWSALWAAAWEVSLDAPVDSLLDASSVKRLVDELADSEFAIEVLRPLVDRLLRAAIEELRRDEQPLDQRLPSEVRERIRAVLTRPGLIHPDWVHATLRGEAVEAVLNDTLYRVLSDFSTVIPRAMTRAGVLGRFSMIGGAGALAEKLIREVEKLVEPEIRGFLGDQTGRVLETMAGYVAERIDDPEQLEFRANLVEFVLSRSPSFLFASVDDDFVADLESIVAGVTRHLAASPDARKAIHAGIDRAMAYCEGKCLRDVLELPEDAARPPIAALAASTWPVYERLIGSPHASRWLDGLVDELLDFVEQA